MQKKQVIFLLFIAVFLSPLALVAQEQTASIVPFYSYELHPSRSKAIELKNQKRSISREVEQLKPSLESWYQILHRNPELGYQERKTASFLNTLLTGWGWKVTTDIGGSNSLVAEWNGEKQGRTILIKVAMDALPYSDRTDSTIYERQMVNYGGKSFSLMHGAGNDASMAVALGLAKLITQHKNVIEGNVLIAFQSGEYSTILGKSHGSDVLLYSDYFIDHRPDFAIGYQFDPSLEVGKIAFHKGPALPSTTVMNINFYPQAQSTIDFVDNTQLLYTAFSQVIVPFQRIVYEERFLRNQDVRIDFNAINGAPFVDVPAQELEATAMIFAYDDATLCRVQDRLAWSLFSSVESIGISVASAFYKYSPVFVNSRQVGDLLLDIQPFSVMGLDKKQFYFNSFSKYAQASKAGGFFFMVGAGKNIDHRVGTFNIPSDRFFIDQQSLTEGLITLYQLLQLVQTSDMYPVNSPTPSSSIHP